MPENQDLSPNDSRGFQPFPLDMLGRDGSVCPASPRDELLAEIQRELRQVLYRFDYQTNRLVWISDSAEAVLGVSAEELPRMNQEEFLLHIHPQDLGSYLGAFHIRLPEESGRIRRTLEYRWRKGNSFLWVRHQACIRLDEQGRKLCSTGMIEDISTEKRAVNEVDDRFRLALESSNHLLYRYNLKRDQYEYVSPTVESISGYSAREIMARSLDDAIDEVHPDDRDVIRRVWNEIHETPRPGGDSPYYFELRRKHKQGHYYWVADAGTMYHDAAGAPERLVGVVTEISQRKQAEVELCRNQTELLRAQKIARMGSAYLDFATGTMTWSEGMYRLVELDPAEAPGPLSPAEINRRFIHPDDLPAVETIIEDQWSKGIFEGIEYRIITTTGRLRTLWLEGELQRDEDGTIVGVHATVWDVSEQKEMLEALRKARDELETRVEERTEELRRSEEAERMFRRRLAALNDMNIRLSRQESVEEVCRLAVELGREQLGFDRLSIWLREGDSDTVRGTWGTDEQGRLRDERHARLSAVEYPLVGDIMAGRSRLAVVPEYGVRNHRADVVGRAAAAVAALQSGNDVIGYVSTDNLITGLPLLHQQCELLVLFAATVGHICTRKRAELALEQARLQLLDAGEAERRRLAKELHDSVAQNLVVLQLLLKRVSLAMENTDELIQTGKTICGDVIEDIRRVCQGLYPPMLETLGLQQTLENLLESYRAVEINIEFRVASAVRDRRVSPPAEIALFRIAQEALSNAVRHGGAGEIVVSLEGGPDELVLSVRDDGVGFDVAKAEQHYSGLGLRNIRDRAHAVNASLWITSDQSGTEVKVCYPLE